MHSATIFLWSLTAKNFIAPYFHTVYEENAPPHISALYKTCQVNDFKKILEYLALHYEFFKRRRFPHSFTA